MSVFLPPLAGTAHEARAVATDACLRWHVEHLVGPACLVASELVTNAVQHAETTMTMRLSLVGDHLLVEVEDGCVRPPMLRPLPAPTDPAPGRGLVLVARTAARSGWVPTPDGKIVWATLRR
ncbi:ATP-binding protein [Asanoa sp. NPDC049518]|uniref:ATP-binding protein n=1 Tax=unclassified Asanoa TaxID=2685164 RepID=UPI0034493BDE